jgi:hypothetical protein
LKFSERAESRVLESVGKNLALQIRLRILPRERQIVANQLGIFEEKL